MTIIFLNTSFLDTPKFCKTQRVFFAGGEGIVCSVQAQAGKRIYLVEMAMGSEPICGRLGGETMVLLNEADLQEYDEASKQVTNVWTMKGYGLRGKRQKLGNGLQQFSSVQPSLYNPVLCEARCRFKQ